MLLSPTIPFGTQSPASTFVFNSHHRIITGSASPGAAWTSNQVTISDAARGAVLCLVEVDGSGGTLTGVADNVRMDGASGAAFTHQASVYNSVRDHVASLWTINNIPTGAHSIHIDYNASEVGTNAQMVLVLFESNLNVEAATFSGLAYNNASTSMTDSVSLSGLPTDDKFFVAFHYQDYGGSVGSILEDTTADYTALITSLAPTGVPNTGWDTGSPNTDQSDETGGVVFYRHSSGGITSESFTAAITTGIAKPRRFSTGLIALTEAI